MSLFPHNKKKLLIFFIFLTLKLHPEGNFPEINFNESAQNLNPVKSCHRNARGPLEKRKWGILAYFAMDNDLHYFAWNNIKQLASGANENCYIVVQLNEPGKNKRTQRYLIEKNKAILLNKNDQQKLDSGDPQTLIDFCTWAIKNFPAQNYMLDLSNHGSGAVDRNAARLINPAELFVLNPSNLMLELDRSIEYLDYIGKPKREDNLKNEYEDRGICFDEAHNSYLTNQKLDIALNTICTEAAKITFNSSFKFSIIGMDACLMQMIEIANYIKKYANIMIASVEVELGPGWRYDKILNPLKDKPLEQVEFAKHIVKAYEEAYSGITNDYTLSALDLTHIDDLEKNINTTSEILIEMLQSDNNVKTILKKSKTSVAFEEPSYIDIGGLYNNILKNLKTAALNVNPTIKEQLINNLQHGLNIIAKLVLENCTGKNISYSKGLSIYFPEKRIHNSYRKTNFAQNNQWINFLLHYISQ